MYVALKIQLTYLKYATDNQIKVGRVKRLMSGIKSKKVSL